MKNFIFMSLLVTVFLIPLEANYALAQSTHTINIPTGAGSPDAPYFWQNEDDGSTDGKVTINLAEYVNWENADTVPHTITSGTPKDGPDGKFDSGIIKPGDSFMYQFKEVGTYPYFDIVHPWMSGVVVVQSAFQVIQKVGTDAGDGKTTFDVEYDFNRVIASARVDQPQKAITFELVGKPMGTDNTLTLMLPKALINGPFVVWADGKQITDFETTSEGGINQVKIPLNSNSERLTITGTNIVPEFGPIAMAVLAIGVFGLIALSLRAQKFIRLNSSSL